MSDARPRSLFRPALALAALALAACAGPGVSSLPSAGSPAAALLRPAATSGWVFHGSSATGSLSKKAGGTIALKAYKDITTTVGIGNATAGPATYSVTVSEALDSTKVKDVTGKVDGKSFPTYTGGYVLMYLDVHNAGATAATWAKTPKLTFAFPSSIGKQGAVCGISQLSSIGVWESVDGNNGFGTMSTTGLTILPFKTVGKALVLPAKGNLYLAVYCPGY